jgi:hypothetical protein
MADDDIVMTIDKPKFTVKLYRTFLKLDLKEGVRRELEKAVEANTALRETLGLLFQTVVPLDVELKNIKTVDVDKEGRVRVVIPRRRDLHIPLDKGESESFVEKLNELVQAEKERAQRELQEAKRAEYELTEKRGMMEKELSRGRTV